MASLQRVEELLQRFAGLRVLVVGDICLDRWCQYDPALSEASRETGIPRVAVVQVECTAGASGTIANNLSDLGVGYVSVMGVIGEDGHGKELFAALGRREISVDLVFRSEELCTFTYVKHINRNTGQEDLPRVDFVNTAPIPAALEAQLIVDFVTYASRFDAIIICDQAETESGGVITSGFRDAINRVAADGHLVWVDSRRRAEHFEHCYLKPNEQEAAEAAQRLLGNGDLEALRQRLHLRAVVMTQGEHGARIIDEAGTRQLPPGPVSEVVDICGAGDSFSAGAVASLAAGASLEEAVAMGNLVASITVTKKGTGTASPAELRHAAERAAAERAAQQAVAAK
jgi:rfaE bifunctional protein kinase chain/domain